MIRAVGYARRSTDMQERSIPDQQAYVEKWAKEHGYEIVRWFIDDAISGTSTKGRNAFEQLISTAENGRDFETVLCYDISRFSRGGTNETGFYLHRLKLAGVDVVFTADGIPEGDEGELIQGVKSWQARQYSVKLARDSIRGQISNIKERKSAPGGPPPYGYDKQHVTPDGKVLRTLRWMADGSKQEFGPDGKLVRVIPSDVYVAKAKGDIVRYTPSTPDRVTVIRRIFDLCAKGYGIKYTAELLNKEGVPSMKGALWNPSNIAMMLRCPVYRGAIVYNKRTSGALFGMDSDGKLRPKKERGAKLNPQNDWMIVEDVHEPLVSKETFDAVTRMRAINRVRAGKARSVRRSLTSTLFVCSRCKFSFTSVRDTRYGDKYRKYTCSGYHRYGKNVCQLYNIPGVPMDAFLLSTIREVIFRDHANTNKAIDAFLKAVLSPTKASKQSPDMERELEQLNRRIKTTVGMLADLSFDGIDDLNKVLIDLKAKRDALVAKLATKQPKADGLLTERELRAWAKEQLQRLEEVAQKTTVELPDRQLVESYVDRIEVFPETKTGVIVMHADLRSFFESSSTRVVGGDDPQTDESARSVSQCQQRESILAGAVLGLAGPGQKISGIMPCTVIRPGDMADRILSRDHHPQWQGERTRMVYQFPTEAKLWERYAEIRAEGLRNEDGGVAATEFYRTRQEAMDAGAVVAWPVRFNYDELSAIQHAMNLKYQDEAAFWAEYQNEPLPEVQADENELTADQIAAKLNGLPKGRVPLGCQHLTMFIDVQQKLLFYAICAWAEEFSGAVLEYGAWPDPQRSYFSLRDVTRTLSTVTPGTGLEGAIYAGLQALTERQLAREWHREDGASLRIERCLIDANWGTSTDVVYQFCRQSPHAALLLPSHGRFVGASSLPFADYKRRPGDRVGLNWRIPGIMGKRAVRHVSFDTNFWKSFVFARLAVAMADKGSLALFGQKPEPHRLFAEHMTAEYRVRTEGRGRTVDEWKPRPGQPDNHWLDGIVGCAVGASILGVKLMSHESGESSVSPTRIRLSALQRRKAR
jgi:DNA invertase Pin-like site-specific DNA recombinase